MKVIQSSEERLPRERWIGDRVVHGLVRGGVGDLRVVTVELVGLHAGDELLVDARRAELLSHEIVSVALNKLHAGMAPELVQVSLGCFVGQSLTLHRTDPVAQLALAARYRLSACDAAYLWLAGELHAPVATFDPKLAKASTAHLGGPA